MQRRRESQSGIIFFPKKEKGMCNYEKHFKNLQQKQDRE